MTTPFEYSVKDALSCAARQSEAGVINSGWGKLAYIVEQEFMRLTAVVELFGIDFDELFAGDKFVGIAHRLNNRIIFFDKRRHEFSSVTPEELEAHKRRSLNIAARVTRHG